MGGVPFWIRRPSHVARFMWPATKRKKIELIWTFLYFFCLSKKQLTFGKQEIPPESSHELQRNAFSMPKNVRRSSADFDIFDRLKAPDAVSLGQFWMVCHQDFCGFLWLTLWTDGEPYVKHSKQMYFELNRCIFSSPSTFGGCLWLTLWITPNYLWTITLTLMDS